MHNGNFPTQTFKEIFPFGVGHVTVEPFARFLKTVLAMDCWKARDFRIRAPTEPASRRQPLPSPWRLMKHVPNREEYSVLSVLLEILFYLPPVARKKYLVFRDGKPWVSVTQANLAAKCGCSERSVQRAVAGLRDNGLLETRVNEYRQNDMRVRVDTLLELDKIMRQGNTQ